MDEKLYNRISNTCVIVLVVSVIFGFMFPAYNALAMVGCVIASMVSVVTYFYNQWNIFVPPDFTDEEKEEKIVYDEATVSACIDELEEVANCFGTGPWTEGYEAGVDECIRRVKQRFAIVEEE